MTGTVDIIIVNWNSRELLGRCLMSISTLAREHSHISEVIVVDNASSDGSADSLPDCNCRLSVTRNRENAGFAAACNQGAALGRGAYILFLNPDTEMRPGVLERAMRAYDECGTDVPSAIGVQLITGSGDVARSCARFPTPTRIILTSIGVTKLWPAVFTPQLMSDWDHLSSRRVDQVIGAFFLVRRRDFEFARGFDERFFVYYEEVDYCKRWSSVGRSCLYLADVRLIHHEHGSSRHVVDIALFYSLRSRLLYAGKHFGIAGRIGAYVGALLVEPFSRLAKAMLAGRQDGMTATMSAYRYLVRWIVSGEPKKSAERRIG